MAYDQITRRSFFKLGTQAHQRISHFDSKWPNQDMGRLHQPLADDEPFVFALPEPSSPPEKKNITASLKSLSPQSWDMDKAAHLLRRTVPGATYSDIKRFYDMGLDAAVDALLQIKHKPNPPGDWVTEEVPNFRAMTTAQRQEYQTLYRNRRIELIEWWQGTILKSDVSIIETMTIFWHEHFATNAQKVYFPQAIYEQNDAIRTHCLGNFKDLLRKVTFGPAMMIWLDSYRSRKQSPNENFPRELLELFTMGVDTYSQDDIVAASRAFTGYSTDGYLTNYHFDAKRADGDYYQKYHDFNHKTFLGKHGYFDGDDIIDIIMEQDAVANFICTKIYKWFVYELPDENFVKEMARVFRDNNYNIPSVMRYLLTSEHFYDNNIRGAQIPNPAIQVLGLIRRMGHGTRAFPSKYILRYMEVMGMVLLYPPDVNGWTGHRAWINSVTLPIRKLFSTIIIDPNMDQKLKFETNLVNLAWDLPNPNNARQLVKDLALVYFGLPISEVLEDKLVEILLDGAAEYDWEVNATGADTRLRGLYNYMLRLPEAQLI
ncbi:MAG: DUF1800 domain-containing protein [Candidatus Marinimicrobia bacterium]|jgi:uncharacterized protein (DUF1800 family)|nr:DUF1800 domain-containing protein [Candidatus Neomarinimicrobiota bacterium]